MSAPRRRWVVLGGAVALVLLAIWVLRWQIGTEAFRIVEPAVRDWGIREVARLSDSVYRLELSPIEVTADQRRVAVARLRLTTDSARNRLRTTPYPHLDVTLHGCAVTELDLERLAAGAGLRAGRAGCDSVAAAIRVPADVSPDTTTDAGFLTLRDTLALPDNVPRFAFDTFALPNVRMDLRIMHDDGDSTALAFERLAVMFDSMGYDPDRPASRRRPLLSRDVVVALRDAEGSRGSDHLTVTGLRASLAGGTLALDDLAWTPLAGARADSLGVHGVRLDTLALAGVDWEEALIEGNLIMRSLHASGARVTTVDAPPRNDRRDTGPGRRWTLDASLNALHRVVRVDTLRLEHVEVQHAGRDARTAARTLQLTGLAVGGPVEVPGASLRLASGGLEHAWRDHRATIDTITVDLPAGTLEARGLEHRTVGTDGQFAARRRWRTDRIGLAAAALRVGGFAAAEWIRAGAYRARSVDVSGMRLDIFSDKQMPARPVPASHRTPQAWLRQAPIPMRLDTVTVRGAISYRERGKESGMIGELEFTESRIGVADFATGSGSASRPIRVLATTRLMGVAPMEVRVELPRTPGFEMTWSGRVGAFEASLLNPMLIGATDFALAEGRVDWIDFTAETHDGRSMGTVRPRYRDLELSLPGVGRSGALGGVRRAIAGAVANAFVVRGDNHEGASDPAINGDIAHSWSPRETLIQHLWFALRDGLRRVVTP